MPCVWSFTCSPLLLVASLSVALSQIQAGILGAPPEPKSAWPVGTSTASHQANLALPPKACIKSAKRTKKRRADPEKGLKPTVHFWSLSPPKSLRPAGRPMDGKPSSQAGVSKPYPPLQSGSLAVLLLEKKSQRRMQVLHDAAQESVCDFSALTEALAIHDRKRTLRHAPATKKSL